MSSESWKEEQDKKLEGEILDAEYEMDKQESVFESLNKVLKVELGEVDYIKKWQTEAKNK